MFYVSASTDAGRKKTINQDSLMVQKFKTAIGQVVFACVCDGMGGLQSGELASATMLYGLKKWASHKLPYLTSRPIQQDILFEQWQNAINEYNKKIIVHGQNSNLSLGTTLTAALFTEKEYYMVNVGDSRAYEIEKTVKQLTHDHTYVQQEVDNGRMSPEEAKISNKKHILTRCIGVKEDIHPDYFFGHVKKNSIYMLCSDGFRHKISDEEFTANLNASVLRSSDDLKKSEMRLIALNKERLENDNISVVTVMVK